MTNSLNRLSIFFSFLIHHSYSNSADDTRLPPTMPNNPPSHNFFKADDNFRLSCSASGVPKPSYEWYKNGRSLNLNVNNIQRLNMDTIIINNAGQVDEGYYQCQAVNQYGRALSNLSYWQKAFMTSSQNFQEEIVFNVTGGRPFVLQMKPINSIPRAVYSWEKTEKPREDKGTPITLDRRIQMSENGDLHFSYAVPGDSLNGFFYKANAFNKAYDTRVTVSYIKVNVISSPDILMHFAPILGFSSPSVVVVLEGDVLKLKCFFSANPEAKYHWRHPGGILPLERYQRSPDFSEIFIRDVRLEDKGNYICTASNNKGVSHHGIEVVVEATPRFEQPNNVLTNLNITEGKTAIFKCLTYAKPHARNQWYIDGEVLDFDELPSRISISSDRTQLQVRDVCRDCTDRFSDLMVVQCNSSNVHGSVFASAYLNVLKRTEVWIQGKIDVSVVEADNEPLSFECFIKSDPSTSARLKWIKMPMGDRDRNFEGEVIHHNPPSIHLMHLYNGGYQLTLSPVGNTTWAKLGGRYKCFGNNGYSHDEKIVNIRLLSPRIEIREIETSVESYLWILLLIALILFLVIFFTCCFYCLCKQKGDVYNVDQKERKSGNNPDKEIADLDIHEYKRPDMQPFSKNSHASLSSSTEHSEDSGSLNDYGDVDPTKFNEDGSFVGAYAPNCPTYSVPRKPVRTQQ